MKKYLKRIKHFVNEEDLERVLMERREALEGQYQTASIDRFSNVVVDLKLNKGIPT